MAWADAGRGLDVTGNVPQSMVLRVELPGCTSAAGMELDLEKNSIDLRIPGWSCTLAWGCKNAAVLGVWLVDFRLVAGKFRLERVLPHVVDDSKAKAKFDKAQQCLEVTLPVVPPKPKVPLHVFSDGASSVGEQQQLVAEIPAHDSAARDGVDGNRELQDGPEGPLIHSEAQDEPGAALMTKDASEVKRQWEEVMRKHDGEVRANQATSLQDDRQQQQMKDQKGTFEAWRLAVDFSTCSSLVDRCPCHPQSPPLTDSHLFSPQATSCLKRRRLDKESLLRHPPSKGSVRATSTRWVSRVLDTTRTEPRAA